MELRPDYLDRVVRSYFTTVSGDRPLPKADRDERSNELVSQSRPIAGN
jgi:hypothetical protein